LTRNQKLQEEKSWGGLRRKGTTFLGADKKKVGEEKGNPTEGEGII